MSSALASSGQQRAAPGEPPALGEDRTPLGAVDVDGEDAGAELPED